MIRVALSVASPITRAGLQALLAAASGLQVVAAEDAPDVIVSDRRTAAGAIPVVLLPRGAEPELADIMAAIRAAAAGLAVLRPEKVELPPADMPADPLSPREIDVLRMMAEGLGNKIIAARLGISENTVKFHVASILARLGAGTRTEAVTIGIRRGLVFL